MRKAYIINIYHFTITLQFMVQNIGCSRRAKLLPNVFTSVASGDKTEFSLRELEIDKLWPWNI